MDIRERHFGRIATSDPETGHVVVDIGSLIRRLVLFERCTIESIALKEIPALISVFGADGLLNLIDSGSVQIVCDAMTAGQVGQTAMLKSASTRGGVLPLGSYRIVSVGIPLEGPGRDDYVHNALQEVHKAEIPFKVAKKVKLALVPRLMTYSSEAATAGINDTKQELLQRHPVIWKAIRLVVLRETGIDPGPNQEFQVENLGGDGDFRVETSLTTTNGLSPEQAHRLVERGLLAVAGMNQRVHFMESFGAVTGFQTDEAPLFEEKLSFLLKQIDPDAQEERFQRIVTIGGLPDLDPLPAGTTIDVDQLLKLRETRECRELRSWIRNVDSETDEEITAHFDNVRGRIASLVNSRGGKVARFLVTNGAGAIPVAGIVAGPILSAGDSFLLEKIIGKPGPATFLGTHYPSIFNPSPG